jgi:hypothetical protein
MIHIAGEIDYACDVVVEVLGRPDISRAFLAMDSIYSRTFNENPTEYSYGGIEHVSVHNNRPITLVELDCKQIKFAIV